MIRRMREGDLLELSRLSTEVWREMYHRAGAMTPGNDGYISGAKSVEGINTLKNWSDSLILVSIGPGNVLDGAAIASAFGMEGCARLVSLVVRLEMRRMGIGTALLSRMESELARQGVRELELNTLARLHYAVEFYKSRGYEADGRRHVDESRPTATVEMRKKIGK